MLISRNIKLAEGTARAFLKINWAGAKSAGPIEVKDADYFVPFAPPKLKVSNRSSSAGLLVGTYGLVGLVVGLGKLSRVCAPMVTKPQLRSMNLMMETWSA